MNLKDILEGKMACFICFFRNPLPWIAFLVPFLVCTAFVGYGFLPFLLTVLFLVSSSVFFTFSKHKPELLETSAMEDEALTSDQECSPAQEGEVGQVHGYMVGSLDSFSESESIDDQSSSTTDQDSEVLDWPCSGNLGRSPDCSDDGSISDEESLIEIALPNGHTVDPEKEEPKLSLQQHSLVELLADINEVNNIEEDNLIEIDISMGSIKCSRFEIEA